jgi:hypothetical protein
MYRIGTRVRAVEWAESDVIDDSETVPAGTLGVVDSVDDAGTVHVRWSNGARLGATIEDVIVRVHPVLSKEADQS